MTLTLADVKPDPSIRTDNIQCQTDILAGVVTGAGGLLPGDLICRVGGVSVHNSAEVIEKMSRGGTFTVEVTRQGEQQTISVVIP